MPFTPTAYVEKPTGADVASFIQPNADQVLQDRCTAAVAVIVPLAKGYTRGNGFLPNDTVSEEIAAVIIAAAARLAANPEQLDLSQVGTTAIRGGFRGWTLVERMVLDQHRGRAV